MNPPFYILSSGDESMDETTPNTSLSGSTHDTSRAKYNLQDVETFATDLNNASHINLAAKSAFPNRGRSRYETVNACLIRWYEDELFVEPEITRLDNIFQDYWFKTNRWQIPTKNSHLDLMMKAGELILDADNENNLFIVYYGGHGRINNERQAEWLCKRDPSSARVHWSAVQTLFAEAQSDVLILLDACAAASATTRSLSGSMEAIMACGFESKAPPPGEHSFTNTLINKGREGKKLEWCVTPIYINCTQDSKAPSIELCRRNILPHPVSSTSENEENQSTNVMDLDFDDPLSSPLSSLSSLAPSGQYRIPHVIISVALEENQPDLDVKNTARWLASIPFLAKWAKVEGVFKSYSTILFLSVPVPVWNMLPDRPACSFVGYVTSPNLITNISPSIELEAESPLSSAFRHSAAPSSSPVPTTAFSNLRINNDSRLPANNPPTSSPLPNQQSSQPPSRPDISRTAVISRNAGQGNQSPNQPLPTSPITLSGSTPASRSHGDGQLTPGGSISPQNNDHQYQASIHSREGTEPTSLRRGAQMSTFETPSSSGTIEIFKSVYVHMEDPCYKILLAALKKYNINASWEQYALYIICGDMERCIGAEEKPLILFQELDKQGKKPVFMLRKKIPTGVAQPVWGVLYARIIVAV
ncbi:hypothetical protein BGZ57DRAFT_962528 [Hyaloscypha finlandica]|nr:hypothetical protein BGZ57DRAFT_962528 [Hyaloscypha finlandica]